MFCTVSKYGSAINSAYSLVIRILAISTKPSVGQAQKGSAEAAVTGMGGASQDDFVFSYVGFLTLSQAASVAILPSALVCGATIARC
jgi:hypothetical protein